MLALSHTIHDSVVKNAQIFGTLTLLPKHNRKTKENQQKAMDMQISALNRLLIFEEMKGTYELTKRGVVHAHFIASIRENFITPDMGIKESDIKDFILKVLYANMNIYGRCDFQYIKNHEHVKEYLTKEYEQTKYILHYTHFGTYHTDKSIKKSLEVKELELKHSTSEEVNSKLLDHGIKISCNCCDDNDVKLKI